MAHITVIVMVVVVLRNITYQILYNGAGSCQAGLPLGPLAQHKTTFPHEMRLEQRESGGEIRAESVASISVFGQAHEAHLLRKCSIRASCPS